MSDIVIGAIIALGGTILGFGIQVVQDVRKEQMEKVKAQNLKRENLYTEALGLVSNLADTFTFNDTAEEKEAIRQAKSRFTVFCDTHAGVIRIYFSKEVKEVLASIQHDILTLKPGAKNDRLHRKCDALCAQIKSDLGIKN